MNKKATIILFCLLFTLSTFACSSRCSVGHLEEQDKQRYYILSLCCKFYYTPRSAKHPPFVAVFYRLRQYILSYTNLIVIKQICNLFYLCFDMPCGTPRRAE